MQSRRAKIAAIRLAVLCCFAASIVPRAAVYTHQHEGTAPGHVHAWDGSRLDDLRALIDEAEHGHTHALGHEHDHGEPARGHQHEHAGRQVAGHAERAAHGPGIAVEPPGGSTHAHWQAPFQTVARAGTPALVALERRASTAVTAALGRSHEPARALRARSPRCPPSESITDL